jgi:hypothetical protein
MSQDYYPGVWKFKITFLRVNRNKMKTNNNKQITVFFLLGVAFNNYDRFVETITGKDTLYDTVGIVYQDIFDCFQENPDADHDDEQVPLNGERQSSRCRRAFRDSLSRSGRKV